MRSLRVGVVTRWLDIDVFRPVQRPLADLLPLVGVFFSAPVAVPLR
jgi:hypothetical protein